MAAGAWTVYSNAMLGMSKASFNLSTDTYAITLVTNSYTPAPNTDTLWSSVSANELTTAGGYTAGGIVLASETDTLATATVTFTSASPTWTTFSAGPFRYGVIVRRAGGSLVAGDLLLCYSDLGGGSSITGTGGTFTVTISGSGIFTLTHSP
jgi:hypothetical protein